MGGMLAKRRLDKSEDVRSFISLSLRREFIPALSRGLRKTFPLACYRRGDTEETLMYPAKLLHFLAGLPLTSMFAEFWVLLR